MLATQPTSTQPATVDLDSAIAELPTTSADDVAAFLLGQDCKGLRWESAHCPVANYLFRRTPRGGWRYTVTCKGLLGRWFPSAISEFILAFDAGKYPALEMQADTAPANTASTNPI